MELEPIEFAVLTILEQMFKKHDMSWSGIVTISRENVERVHDSYHGVYHAIPELSYDSAIRVFRTFLLLFFCSSVAESSSDSAALPSGYGSLSSLALLRLASLMISVIMRVWSI